MKSARSWGVLQRELDHVDIALIEAGFAVGEVKGPQALEPGIEALRAHGIALRQVSAVPAAAAGLRVVDELAFGPDYAETCRRWHRAYLAQRDTVRAQGFDGRFERLWTFYLAYCEAGFDEGDIDVIQFTLEHAP